MYKFTVQSTRIFHQVLEKHFNKSSVRFCLQQPVKYVFLNHIYINAYETIQFLSYLSQIWLIQHYTWWSTLRYKSNFFLRRPL